MSRLIPENMKEIQQKVNYLRKFNPHYSEHRLILRTVLNLFQIYLNNAEEGHYDTADFTRQHWLEVKNVNQQRIDLLKPRSGSFVTDFKRNSLWVRIQLEERADRIAEANS